METSRVGSLADGLTWNSLHGVRLGRHERYLLVEADKCRGDYQPYLPFAVTADTKSERVAVFRAARRLAELRLLEYEVRGAGSRRQVVLRLTRRGDLVATRFGAELASGERIRWPRSDERDGRFRE